MTTNKFNFFVTMIGAMMIIVFGPISINRWVDGHPTNDDKIGSISSSSSHRNVLSAVNDEKGEIRREKIHEHFIKIFGNHPGIGNESKNREKIVPHFMIELFDAVADSRGNIRGETPHGAKIVRSFIEISSEKARNSHLYRFNCTSGLETNESVLKAELHLHLSEMWLQIHPSLKITVYQVLDGKNVTEPALHRLLSSHQVVNDVGGWQFFDVTPAVIDWISGTPNLGLIITTANLTNHYVDIDFSREISTNLTSNQPILVLFNSDHEEPSNLERSQIFPANPNNEPTTIESNGHDERHDENKKILKTNLMIDETENIVKFPLEREKNDLSSDRVKENSRVEKSEIISRNKRETIEFEKPEMTINETTKSVYERRTKESQSLTSIDIYKGALLRQRRMIKSDEKSETEVLEFHNKHRCTTKPTVEKINHLNDTNDHNTINNNKSPKRCRRHELTLDYEELGRPDIIAPERSDLYQCLGRCDIMTEQDQDFTANAVLREIFLLPGVTRACCVPTKLSSTSLLFINMKGNAVMRIYNDAIVERCSCL